MITVIIVVVIVVVVVVEVVVVVVVARCSSVSRTFAHGAMGCADRSLRVDPLSSFSFQPVIHDWCNKGRGMCYSVCGMMHIKEHLLLI